MINNGASTINDTLTTTSESVGYTLSDSMETIWNTNSNNITSVVSTYGGDITSALITTNTALNSIKTYVASIVKSSNTTATSSSNTATTNSATSTTKTSTSSATTSSSSSKSASSSSSSSSSSWGSWFISKKDSYAKSKLNKDTSIVDKDTSIVDRLKYFDFDSSFAARTTYYTAMGLGSNYTDSASQNIAMLNAMKSHGFHSGGTIGELVNKSSEDGFILAQTGEEVLSLDKIEALEKMFDELNPILNQIWKIPDANSLQSGTGFGQSVNIDSMNLEVTLPNVQNYDDFKYAMQYAPVSWITVILGTHGRSFEIDSACATGTVSIGMGYEDILSSRCDMSVCGGSDCINDEEPVLVKGFEYLKALSSSPEGKSYPFSKERCGFMFSEGAATVIVLEELEHAKKRNARIYAEITGFETSSDAYSMVSMPSEGEYIKPMLKKLIGGKKVDYYNAHATGTILNDEVECKVIQEIFGDMEKQPAISATKSIIGHSLGASGTIEAIVCVNSILNGKVHGNNCRTIMENLNITSEARAAEIDRAVSASFGFGGHNAAIMIERYTDEVL